MWWLCLALAVYDAPTNPGTMGVNALPAWAADGPWTHDHTRFSLGTRYSEGRAGDRAVTPTFRLEMPFFGIVTATFDGTPFESWWAPAAARVRLGGTTAPEGFSKGDIRFGARFLLYNGEDRLPSVAFRFATKTTTGKDRSQRRFTDAPGYLLDVLLGQRLTLSDSWRVELALALGFFAWQQSFGQNDAVHVAALSTWRFAQDLELRLGLRSYFGWQRNDKPFDLDLGATWFFCEWFGVSLDGSVGASDAPVFSIGAGITFRIPFLLPVKPGTP